jgi:hypothetical protein
VALVTRLGDRVVLEVELVSIDIALLFPRCESWLQWRQTLGSLCVGIGCTRQTMITNMNAVEDRHHLQRLGTYGVEFFQLGG